MLRLALLLAASASVALLRVSADPSGPQHHTIDMLTSLFENSTPVLQYGYCENIGDGRGFTAGRAGFTTGTDDLLQVVQLYTQREPSNPLAALIPALQAVDGTGNTDGLNDLCNEWQAAANNDPVFRQTQDDVSNSMYWNPSLDHSHTLGLSLPISFGQMYDAIIQHGDGDDTDGLPQMISEANSNAGGSPAQGVDEQQWLGAFFDVRIKHLLHAADPNTAPDWAQSVDRVYCYQRIAASNNWQLDLPMYVTAYGEAFTLTPDMLAAAASRNNHQQRTNATTHKPSSAPRLRKLKLLTEQ